MKKLTLIVTFLGFAIGTKAQSFSMDKDSSKKYWSFAGYELQPHILFTNTTSSGLDLKWKMAKLYKDAGWVFGGACDNVTCHGGDTPGLEDGSHTFPAKNLEPGEVLDFKMAFNGNEAANLTKALATIEIWTGSETPKKATFAAYKGTTGISTTILRDNEVSIFPNPASDYIDVVFSPSSDVRTIAVYNLIGKAVNVYKVTDQNSARCIFNTDMPSGIYIVRISNSKGNVIATKKMTHQ